MTENSTEQLQEFMIREITIVQQIIARLESKSFLIKGWTIALVAVALLLDPPRSFEILALVAILGLWVYDAYHVWLIRMYAKLHQWIATNRLQTSEHLFDMSIHTFRDEVHSMARTLFSARVVWFYGCLLLFVVLYLLAPLLP